MRTATEHNFANRKLVGEIRGIYEEGKMLLGLPTRENLIVFVLLMKEIELKIKSLTELDDELPRKL